MDEGHHSQDPSGQEAISARPFKPSPSRLKREAEERRLAEERAKAEAVEKENLARAARMREKLDADRRALYEQELERKRQEEQAKADKLDAQRRRVMELEKQRELRRHAEQEERERSFRESDELAKEKALMAKKILEEEKARKVAEEEAQRLAQEQAREERQKAQAEEVARMEEAARLAKMSPEERAQYLNEKALVAAQLGTEPGVHKSPLDDDTGLIVQSHLKVATTSETLVPAETTSRCCCTIM